MTFRPHPRPAIDAVRTLLQADQPLLDRAIRAAQDGSGSCAAVVRWAICVQSSAQLLLLASEPLTFEGSVLLHDRLGLMVTLLRDVLTLRISPLDSDRVPVLAAPIEPCVLPMPIAHLIIQTSLVVMLAAVQTGAQAVAVLIESDPLAAEQGYPEGIVWRITADAPGVTARVMTETWREIEELVRAFGGRIVSRRDNASSHAERDHYSWELGFWSPAAPPLTWAAGRPEAGGAAA